MSASYAQKIFTNVYNSSKTREIPFDKEWSNGTGYFDHAIYGEHAVEINNGEVLKSMSPGNRRILFLGTRLGTIAVFDRFSGSEKDIFVHNTTTAIERGRWIRTGALSEEDMGKIFGGYELDDNLAQVIDDIYSGCKKSNQG